MLILDEYSPYIKSIMVAATAIIASADCHRSYSPAIHRRHARERAPMLSRQPAAQRLADDISGQGPPGKFLGRRADTRCNAVMHEPSRDVVAAGAAHLSRAIFLIRLRRIRWRGHARYRDDDTRIESAMPKSFADALAMASHEHAFYECWLSRRISPRLRAMVSIPLAQYGRLTYFPSLLSGWLSRAPHLAER